MFDELLKQYDCEAIIINDLITIRYLSGFKGSNGLYIYGKTKKYFITDARYELEASLTVRNAEIIIVKSSGGLWDFASIFKDDNLKRFGVFSNTISLNLFEKLSQNYEIISIGIDPALYRIKKNKQEILYIKRSIEIQERSFKESLSKFAEFPTEKEYAASLDYIMQITGSEKLAFDTIVAFGENSAMPHAKPSGNSISGDGLLVIDFGAVFDGYCSDQTVTLIFGKPDKILLDLYDSVYTAQKKAIDAVKPGIKISDLYKIAYGYLENQGYSKFIQHGLGHGVGLAIHELPIVSSTFDTLLEEGFVITIEPGLYIPQKGGVRLEDMVYVTSNGADVLTSLPKERKVIL